MNREETIVVVLLFCALMGWMFFFGKQQRSETLLEDPAAEVAQTVTAEDTKEAEADIVDVDKPENIDEEAVSAVPDETLPELPPEQSWVISNQFLHVWISSRGGAVTRVAMPEFFALPDETGGAVEFDFSRAPAAAVTDWSGFGSNSHFRLIEAPAPGQAVFECNSGTLTLRRTFTLEGYRMDLRDVFSNSATVTVSVAKHGINLGRMPPVQSNSKGRAMMNYLAVDSMPLTSGRKVRHYSKQIGKLFGAPSGIFNCGRVNPVGLPIELKHDVNEPVRWVAAKNKFFVQILRPDTHATGYRVVAGRADSTDVFTVEEVGAVLMRDATPLEGGAELVHEYQYYIGPKEYSRLRALPDHQANVMEFGVFGPLCKLLLPALNWLYLVVRNYGLAIIILTVIVRLIFWPVTHKSTESMKKMAEIQPEVKALREKFKNDPQKMNQAVMLLYRERGVNPLAGCLPMLVQIPVFIALFTVLRSAVELRFASFLWISDLSEPEGLLAGMIPFVGSLNILPLFMTGTMVWQQRLTPSAGDPQQQKMMMIMPVVMLFIFYNMPSALVLYWSTSQCLSIGQLLLQQRKKT